MAFGPLELMVLSFPADRFDTGVRTTLDRLTAAWEMRVVDVLVVRTDAAGTASAVELSELPGLRDDRVWLARLASGLITESDVTEVGAQIGDRRDALAVLLEHRWVRDLADEVAACNGTVVALTHIPGAPDHCPVRTRSMPDPNRLITTS
ncbi:DUF6325 family protein [Actinoplanes sp. NBC_00393]|uniref:DUF6325 family protein n=1 Tax=Actinoplanes sp. NBC_00393 TaxID=2975953 RepID=UPI002E227D0F